MARLCYKHLVGNRLLSPAVEESKTAVLLELRKGWKHKEIRQQVAKWVSVKTCFTVNNSL